MKPRYPSSDYLRRLLFTPVFATLALGSLHAQAVAPSPTATSPADPAAVKKPVKPLTKEEQAAIDKTAAASAEKGKEESSAVVLSPFEVSSGDEKGYSASSSLSGSRLNSKLEDLAGSISVVTKQQLLDTAALDINDIFSYEIGTEGTKQFTDLSGDGRGDYDNVSGNPNTSNRVRGLAAANLTVDGFTANSNIPIDAGNLDAVEISRGSNSTLAGVGDAGGTVNLVQGRANVSRETTGLVFRADSYGGFLSSITLNRPIFRNKFALRAYLTYGEVGYERKPSVDRTTRQQIGFTYKPFRKTTVSGSYESFNEFAQRANSGTPRDTITPWRSRGRPTYNPITGIYTVNGVPSAPVTNINQFPTGLGIAGIGSSNVRILQYIDAGQIPYLIRGNAPTNAIIGTNTNVTQFTQSTNEAIEGPLYKLKGSTDKSIYDWEEINLAASNYEIQRAQIASANLDQNLISTPRHQLDFQAAWRREDSYRYQRSFIAQQDGVGNTLEVDTNEKLLDGRANPFFLRPFIGGVNPQVFIKPVFTDSYRWQLAYQLSLSRETNLLKWLGNHRMAAYQEYRLTIGSPDRQGLRYHDTVTNNANFQPGILTGANIANNNGALFYPLYYFGNTKGGGVEYANTGPVNPSGDYRASFLGATSPAWSLTEPVNIQEVFFSGTQQKKKVRTVGASIQSFFLNNQVVTTFGKRKDRQMSESNVPTVVSGGFIDTANLYNFGINKRWREGDTTSRGVVVKPFRSLDFLNRAADQGSGILRFAAQALRGLNLHYNRSDSFKPEDVAYNVFQQELPNPSGESKEWGFSLNMFDGKFNVRVTRQESLQNNTRSGIGVVATRALSIDHDVPGQNQPFDLYQSFRDWYGGTAGLRPDWTPAEVDAFAAKSIGYTVDYINGFAGKSISDTSDATSKGWELELQFNPTRNFTLKLTGAQQIAIDSNVSESIQQYIALRRPLWESVRVPTALRPDGTQLPNAGLLWWNLNNNQAQNYFIGNVESPVNLAITTQGKRKPQIREYSFTGTTKYDLAGIAGGHKWLRNASIGGSYRWASKNAVGYYAGAADPDGVVRRLDRTRPFFDKPVGTANLLTTYRTKLFNNRVNTTFQLNVNNITESGHLQGVGVNPDGKFWQYRIVDPRQYIFQVRFDL